MFLQFHFQFLFIHEVDGHEPLLIIEHLKNAQRPQQTITLLSTSIPQGFLMLHYTILWLQVA